MSEILLEANNFTKNFGSTQALDDFSFAIRKGVIHGLIGENGSGKSTAASIIAGIQKPTSGSMYYRNSVWNPETSLQARDAGIGIIVQEAGTITSLTVAQNIFLGSEAKFRKGFIIVQKEMNTAARKALDSLGLSNIYPEMPMHLLNMQERKLIELAKVLYYDPELLIIDETTTALSHIGRDILYKKMRLMADSGKSVLIISHDLNELMTYCDVLTVLRDGKKITEFEQKDFDERIIKQSMIGRDLSGHYYRTDSDEYSDNIVLKAERITNINSFINLSIELHKGEILGIGGLSHCGMHELGMALFGSEEILTGDVVLHEKKIRILNSEIATECGIAYISKNRDEESVALNSSVYNNIASTGYRINKNTKGLFSNILEKKYVNNQIDELSIKCRDAHQEVRFLSGGNKQKVAYGKWMAVDSDIYIMDCPTRGVDIGVKVTMYQIMYQLKKRGKSILMISEELPELIGMSDRILIMKDGQVNGEFYRRDGFSESELIEYMI